MKRFVIFTSLLIFVFLIVGCGSQNEYLSKGKEWVKSDKRGRIPRAVAQFELAIEKEPDNAEAHYLLGYYDDSSTIERRSEQMVLAYKYDKKKYLKILMEEAIRDRDENVRKSALKALIEIHKTDSLIRPLVKALKGKDSRDRDNAALVLSNLYNHEEVLARLMQNDVLKHKRMSTRFSTVRALGDIGDQKAIGPLMERITALKTEDEKGEEQEVRKAAVVSLRKIAKRNVQINAPLNVQLESTLEGVKVIGGTDNKTTIQKDEIITHVIDNKVIKSMDDYNRLVSEAMQNGEKVIFGLPKIIRITLSNIDELGIEAIKPANGGGIIVDRITVDSRAAKRGIERGEIISYINDQPVNSEEDFKMIVSEAISKGDALNLRITDEDKYSLLEISVSDVITDLGMVVESLPNNAEGVIVTTVFPRSPAIEAGVRKGQIISYVVSKKPTKTPDEYMQFVQEGLVDGKVILSVINKTATSKLIEVLRDKGLIVRFDAAQALGEIMDREAVDSLIEMLEEHTNPIEVSLK